MTYYLISYGKRDKGILLRDIKNLGVFLQIKDLCAYTLSLTAKSI